MKTENLGDYYGDVTTSTYKCPDEECQAESDRDIARMKKRRDDQEAAKELRLERQRNRRTKSDSSINNEEGVV